MPSRETTGRKIERIRRGKHPKVSQEKLALDAGISRGTLVLIESGKTKYPMADTLEQIAVALGVSIYEIVGQEHPIYKVAEKIAEQQAVYRTAKSREGAAFSHDEPRETARKKPGMENFKRRAG